MLRMRQQSVQKQPKPHSSREESFRDFEPELAECVQADAALDDDKENYTGGEEGV